MLYHVIVWYIIVVRGWLAEASSRRPLRSCSGVRRQYLNNNNDNNNTHNNETNNDNGNTNVNI